MRRLANFISSSLRCKALTVVRYNFYTPARSVLRFINIDCRCYSYASTLSHPKAIICTIKKLCRCRGTARRVLSLVTTKMTFRLQAHSRSLVLCRSIGHTSAFFILRHFFHCNYVSILHRFKDIIAYFPKFQKVT